MQKTIRFIRDSWRSTWARRARTGTVASAQTDTRTMGAVPYEWHTKSHSAGGRTFVLGPPSSVVRSPGRPGELRRDYGERALISHTSLVFDNGRSRTRFPVAA